MDIIVIDNAINKQNQELIKMVCFDPFTPWYYNESQQYTSGEHYTEDERNRDMVFTNACPLMVLDPPQLTHSLFNERSGYSSLFPNFISILSAIPERVDLLKRIKLNLLPPLTLSNKDVTGPPHTDMVDFGENQKYFTCLYYVNDSDGDTVIYNEKSYEKVNQLTIKKTVSPKQGRLVMFDGRHIHSPGLPTKNYRAVLNLNFIKE